MVNSADGYSKTKYTFPVVILPGANHASFLAGPTPIAVQKSDLRATVSLETTIKNNAEIVSAFFEITINGKENSSNAVKTVDHYIDDITWPKMGYLLEMFRYEGNSDYSGYKKTNPFVNPAYELVTEPLKGSHSFEISSMYKS